MTKENRWEDVLNSSHITGHISGRHLIQTNVREDNNDENEYDFLDEWIQRKIASAVEAREKEISEAVGKMKKKNKDGHEFNNVNGLGQYNLALNEVLSIILASSKE